MFLTILGILAGGIVSWAITHWYYRKQAAESTDPTETLDALDKKIDKNAAYQSYNTEKIITILTTGGDPRTLCLECENPNLNALLALNILCQGFLVVYAESHKGMAPKSESVNKALMRMGWNNMKSKDMLSKNIADNLELIQKPKWWSDCISAKESSKVLREVRRLSASSVENITQLLDQIISDNGTITPEIVAQAYVTSANLMFCGTLKQAEAEPAAVVDSQGGARVVG